MSGPTAQEIRKAMEEAIEMNPRVKAKFNAIVSFSVDGAEPYILNCKKDGLAATTDKPDLQVKTSLQTLQDLLAKKMSPVQAFQKGKLKVKGKLPLAMKLTMVLDATRKHLNPQLSRL